MPDEPERVGLPSDTRVPITGGLGFNSSNLARRLVMTGADITLVNSLIPECSGNLHKIAGIKRQIRASAADANNPNALQRSVDGVDVIFNLAGQTNHLDSMTGPETDLDINVRAQLSLLEACRLLIRSRQ